MEQRKVIPAVQSTVRRIKESSRFCEYNSLFQAFSGKTRGQSDRLLLINVQQKQCGGERSQFQSAACNHREWCDYFTPGANEILILRWWMKIKDAVRAVLIKIWIKEVWKLLRVESFNINYLCLFQRDFTLRRDRNNCEIFKLFLSLTCNKIIEELCNARALNSSIKPFLN